MSEHEVDALRRVTDAWDRAMIANDADAIGWHMADEWTSIGPDGSVGDRATFLALVRGISGGAYEGRPFHLVERVSSMFVRRDGRWQCVSTHLSLIADPAPA